MLVRKCKLCGEEFANEFDENNHIMVAHAKQTSTNSACNSNATIGTRIRNIHKTISSMSNVKLSSIKKNGSFHNTWAKSFTQRSGGANNKLNQKKSVNVTSSPGNSFIRTMNRQGSIFTCHMCSKKFRNLANLNKHKQSHEGTTVDCPICSKLFVNKIYLASHVEDVHCSEESLDCKLCNENADNISKLKKHILSHANFLSRLDDTDTSYLQEPTTSGNSIVESLESNPNRLDNSNSLSDTTTKPKQKEHKRNNQNLRNRKQMQIKPCDTSQESFHCVKNKQGLTSKENNQNSTIENSTSTFQMENYTDSNNSETTQKRNSFYRNKYEIEKLLEVSCPICSKRFSNESYLQSHILKKHLTIVKCSICNKVESSAKHLSAHMLSHLSKDSDSSTKVQNFAQPQANSSVGSGSTSSTSHCDVLQTPPSSTTPESENVQTISNEQKDIDIVYLDDSDDELLDISQNECGVCHMSFQTRKELWAHIHEHI